MNRLKQELLKGIRANIGHNRLNLVSYSIDLILKKKQFFKDIALTKMDKY